MTMAGNRIDIMDLRQLISLKQKGVSNRKIGVLLNISRNTINSYIHVFQSFKLNYDELLGLDDKSLFDLFPKESEIDNYRYYTLSQYFTYFTQELKRPGCTLYTLWEEYFRKHPDGYKHSQFNTHYNTWREKLNGSGKLEHIAGAKLFVDFTGKKLSFIDKPTGEIQEVNVFVAILPSSQYTFVKAVKTQSREDFTNALASCLEYFGGTPLAIVSDNLKAAVSKSCKYAPQINKTLDDFSVHYGCVIDPTRPYHPQDKALVEGAVKIIYQRIFYPLSKLTIFSLSDLNNEIRRLLELYNSYNFSQRNTSRKQEFIDLEKAHLYPLPLEPYQIKYFKRAKVQKIGYVYLSDDKHYYSVPYRLIGSTLEISYNQNVIEVFHNRERVAFHKRDFRSGKYSTISEHMSSTHRAYSEWSLDFFQKGARTVGLETEKYIVKLIGQYIYPEIGYKQALGILMLKKQYSLERIEKACKRAIDFPKYNYHIINNILKNNLEDLDVPATNYASHITHHENIRGSEAYQ